MAHDKGAAKDNDSGFQLPPCQTSHQQQVKQQFLSNTQLPWHPKLALSHDPAHPESEVYMHECGKNHLISQPNLLDIFVGSGIASTSTHGFQAVKLRHSKHRDWKKTKSKTCASDRVLLCPLCSKICKSWVLSPGSALFQSPKLVCRLVLSPGSALFRNLSRSEHWWNAHMKYHNFILSE